MRRISDITGRESMRFLAKAAPAIINIATDERVQGIFTSKAGADDMTAAGAEALAEVTPLLLDEHADDTLAIMAALDGVTPAEYEAKMTPMSFAADVLGAMGDEGLMDFLASSFVAPEH